MYIIAPARAPLLSWHLWRIYVACTLRTSGAEDDMIQALLPLEISILATNLRTP